MPSLPFWTSGTISKNKLLVVIFLSQKQERNCYSVPNSLWKDHEKCGSHLGLPVSPSRESKQVCLFLLFERRTDKIRLIVNCSVLHFVGENEPRFVYGFVCMGGLYLQRLISGCFPLLLSILFFVIGSLIKHGIIVAILAGRALEFTYFYTGTVGSQAHIPPSLFFWCFAYLSYLHGCCGADSDPYTCTAIKPSPIGQSSQSFIFLIFVFQKALMNWILTL